MPDMSENTTEPGERVPSHATPRAVTLLDSGAPEAVAAHPRYQPEAGALFRALLKAGCDMVTAYTAAEEAKRMAENVMARIDATLTRLADDVGKLATKVDKLSVLVDRHGEILADHGTKLEVLAVRMDGLQREMRLMCGAHRAQVTVLGLVFKLKFARTGTARSGGRWPCRAGET